MNKLSLFVFACLFITLSCKQEKEVFEDVSEKLNSKILSKEKNFMDLIINQKKLLNKFYKKIYTIDKNERKAFLEQISGLSEKNISENPNLFGFESLEEYKILVNHIKKNCENLVKKYPVLLDNEMRNNNYRIIDEAIMLLNNSDIQLKSTCLQKYNNCARSADANLAIATIGCIGAVFIPVIGSGLGPACEAAALAQHFYAVEKCGYDYEDCTNNR